MIGRIVWITQIAKLQVDVSAAALLTMILTGDSTDDTMKKNRRKTWIMVDKIQAGNKNKQ